MAKERFESGILGYERDVFVYTPPGYAGADHDGEPHPLLVRFDGGAPT